MIENISKNLFKILLMNMNSKIQLTKSDFFNLKKIINIMNKLMNFNKQ